MPVQARASGRYRHFCGSRCMVSFLRTPPHLHCSCCGVRLFRFVCLLETPKEEVEGVWIKGALLRRGAMNWGFMSDVPHVN